MKKLWSKLVIALSSFGLLSTLGYYLINLEQEVLGKPEVVKPQKEYVGPSRQGSAPQSLPSDIVIGTVTSVVDGDTIKVKNGGGDVITVRMLGIDTPETSRSPRAKVRGVADCFADEAKAALGVMVQGREVRLEPDPSGDTYDKYSRLLAYPWVGELNVNKEMVRRGFAYEYTYRGRKYKYQAEFKAAQKEAQRTRAGLWAKGVCE